METIYHIEEIVAIIGSLFFGLMYIILFGLLMKGWHRLRHAQSMSNAPIAKKPHTFCILVVCHNEAKHLPTLLHDLQNLEIQPDAFILVDDHSSDNSHELMIQWKKKMDTPVTVIRSQGRGKKQAIQEGLEKADFDWVLTTDADCRVPATWSKQACEMYEKEPFDLLIMPVDMHGKEGIFHSITRMEFVTLVGAGMGLAAGGHPIMCNGANMAFSMQGRKAQEKHLHKEIVSGDDVFLLHAFKKEKGKIMVCARKECLVTTTGNENLRSFLHQRSRWASKASYYTDKESIVVSCCIFGISVWQIILYTISCFNSAILPFAGGIFLGKWICDIIYLYSMRNIFPMFHLIGYSLILSLFYPFYIVYSALMGLRFKSRW